MEDRKSSQKIIRRPSQKDDPNSKRGVRISKILSEKGVCSRREADDFLRKGLILVNGQTAIVGQRAFPDDDISLASEAQKNLDASVTIILNKPVGWVSAQPEDDYQPAIKLLTPENRDKNDESEPQSFDPRELDGLAVAGRLDIDSQGVLIFTQNGSFAKKIIGEGSEVEKEYLVRVKGSIIDGGIELLRHGLELDGKALKPAIVEWLNPDQLKFVLREGKKRQVRRMCEAVGLKAVGLKRVRVGALTLGPLQEGKWRVLGPQEIKRLF